MSNDLTTLLTARPAARQAARWRDELHKARALVVDANATTRSVLAAQLRDLGVGQVVQCGRITEARGKLENSRFDIVLCEQAFPEGGTSGQQLLDELRRHQLLPLTTVFVMITSEATYGQVAEAAESALDSYLLKPHNTTQLAERLAHARRRKAILHDILLAVDEGRYDDAAAACLARFEARADYWLYAARIGAELLLNLGRHEEARSLFDAVIAAKTLPWAKLGVARAQIEGGDLTRAVLTLESLIAEQPGFVDAYDVMGRARLEQGDFDGAMQVYQRAVELTPESLTRLQKAGMLAYYRGQLDEAAKSLERAVAIGAGSKMFDWQSALLLAFARFHQQDGRALQRCCDELSAALGRTPGSVRLQRFVRVASTLLAMQNKRVAEALATLRELGKDLDAPDFDIEAASNFTTLVALLTAAELELPEAEDWIDRIARRHTGSRILTELLARAAMAHPPFAERVQAGHAHVGRLAEAALAHVLAGRPGRAVRELLEAAGQTLSFKLMETARMTLARYRQKIDDDAELDALIEALKPRMAPQRSPMVENNGRKPGALVLRRPSSAADESALAAEVPASA